MLLEPVQNYSNLITIKKYKYLIKSDYFSREYFLKTRKFYG